MNSTSSKNSVTLCQQVDIDLPATWCRIFKEAEDLATAEPQLRKLLLDVILDHHSLADALAARLSRKLAREDMGKQEIYPLLHQIITQSPTITTSAAHDMLAILDRDPACQTLIEPLLFFKGFLALTTYRIAHALWNDNRKPLALYFQSISSEIFGVDIHPGATIGCGILLDHATSIVIGETAIVEDNVSILHEVTLGGTGKQEGARHPIIRSGVLIGAGSKILGRVEIGKNAKIGAGSVVLDPVPPCTTVAGVPAVIVGNTAESNPAEEMNQKLNCKKQQTQ